jgi:Na+/proline symporter
MTFENLNIRAIIAALVIMSFVGLVTLWMLHPPTGDTAQVTMVNTLITMLGTAMLTIVNYLFGSSKGSTDKDETISRAVNGVSVPPATPLQNPPQPVVTADVRG